MLTDVKPDTVRRIPIQYPQVKCGVRIWRKHIRLRYVPQCPHRKGRPC